MCERMRKRMKKRRQVSEPERKSFREDDDELQYTTSICIFEKVSLFFYFLVLACFHVR